MVNLQPTAKLQRMKKLRTRRPARPTTTRLLACVWLSFQGYALFLDAAGLLDTAEFLNAAGRPATLGVQKATGQEAAGGKSDQNEAENNSQEPSGRDPAPPNTESPLSQENSGSEANPAVTPANLTQESGSGPPTVTPEQQEQIDSLIEQLSAPKFSQRESAASELLQIGVPTLASLRKQREITGEAEAKIRITELIKQLIDGQIELQIEDFMAMRPVNFEGWPEIRLLLRNDTIATRALFVEILRSHPTLPRSLQRTQTNRDRNIALASVITAIQKKRTTQMPTTADAFALLLPLMDLEFVMPQECEDIVISVWQSNTGTNLKKDGQLFPGFRLLLGRWMIQSSLANREDVLFYGMNWDMPECQFLAKDTIANEPNASPAVLASCLQALAKFGRRSDVAMVSTLLTDQRPVSRPSITTQGTQTNQVSDLAIAAIACIYGVDLEDVGFTDVRRDPRFGFLPHEIGFPKEAPEQRAAAEKMIKAILDASPPTTPQPGLPPLAPGIGN